MATNLLNRKIWVVLDRRMTVLFERVIQLDSRTSQTLIGMIQRVIIVHPVTFLTLFQHDSLLLSQSPSLLS